MSNAEKPDNNDRLEELVRIQKTQTELMRKIAELLEHGPVAKADRPVMRLLATQPKSAVEPKLAGAEFWSIAQMCKFFECGRTKVEKTINHPAFPRPYRINGGHPKWKKAEVLKWHERQRVKENRK